MKKLIKRLFVYNLCFLIALIAILRPVKVSAYGGYFTEDSFSKNGTYTDGIGNTHDAYTMQNDSALPSEFNYYMRVGNGVAICCSGSELVANILNYKIGLVMSANILTSFITAYLQDTSLIGREPTFFEQHPPVLKNGQLVGIALNELTGCRMAGSENSDSVNVPSDLSNDVYNYYINVWLVNNPEEPDFIILPYVIFDDLDYTNIALTTIQQLTRAMEYGSIGYCVNFNSAKVYDNSSVNYMFFADSRDTYDIATTGYSDVVNNFDLSPNKYEISLEDFKTVKNNNYDLRSTSYNISDGSVYQLSKVYVGGNDDVVTTNQGGIHRCLSGTTTAPGLIPYKDHLTVYKNIQIVQNITNNTYGPSSYTTNNYQNYSTSNDNSYTTNIQNVNNSTSNNTNIYNQAKTETNETIVEDNYNVTQTTIITNITNITNNYYGDNGSGGDDNGGGDDNDDDDDTIWKALLKAIADFFKKIGELIATILTGLISILTSVLTAIASITTSFTAITDFLSAVFGFLPSDLVAVITLGVTLGVLISLIKMLGR